MPRTTAAGVLTALVSIALGASIALADRPPAFSDIAFPEALAANAERDGSLLIVKFTADWCGPCKMMDRTTWSDDAVVEYLRAHRITAIPVDVDRHPDIARANQVRAMPTMVIYRAGVEFDRHTGAMDTVALTAWLDDARRGRTHLDALRERAGDRADADGRVDVKSRLDLARQLSRSGRHDEALDEFLWLWHNMLDHERSMYGVRLSFMVRNMRELAEAHPPALDAFTRLRDDLADRLRAGETSRDNMIDWLTLNLRLLHDNDAIAEWVDRIKDRPTAADTFRTFEHMVLPWMIEQGRWELAGRTLQNARVVIAEKRRFRAMALTGTDARMSPEAAASLRDHYDRSDTRKLADAHAAYLAAGRDEDAWLVADAIAEIVDTETAHAAVCRAALRARAPSAPATPRSPRHSPPPTPTRSANPSPKP
ncbi:MAG: thioredoxin family protein [Phycisphaerales bacterium]|nr:thioredoxin family protein [Planctomycetota bacterium]MCH8508025.1 thioredoxin family protein [Phycisphaerales bacterium]